MWQRRPEWIIRETLWKRVARKAAGMILDTVAKAVKRMQTRLQQDRRRRTRHQRILLVLSD